MTTFLYLQRFVNGAPAAMPFDVLIPILARHGKPGRGLHDTEITFADGVAAGATVIGARVGGALCVGFERPRFDAPLRALVWECMRVLGCAAFDDALEMVYTPLHGAPGLPPALGAACINGVRRVDSAQQLWPDQLETPMPALARPALGYANANPNGPHAQLFDEGDPASQELTIELAIRPEACNEATLRVLRNLAARVDAAIGANPGYQPSYRFVHDESSLRFLESAQLGPLANSATMISPGPGLSAHRPGFASDRAAHAGARAEQARLAAFVQEKYQVALDGSGASINALSALLDKLHAWYVRERAAQPASAAFSSPVATSWAMRAGSYLGSVLASQVGGQWGYVTRGQQRLTVVRTHRGRVCHPHLQVLDHIVNGAHDSVARWYAQLAVSDASACARADDIACRVPDLCALLLDPAAGLPLEAQLPREQLDYSVASLRPLDAYLAQVRQQGAAIDAPELARLADAAGAYLGEVIRSNTPDPSQWQWMNYDDMVRAHPAFARQRPRARGFLGFLDSVEHTTYPLATVGALLADARAESLLDYAGKLLPADAGERAGPLAPGDIEQWPADPRMDLALDQVRNAIIKWRRAATPADYAALGANPQGWLGNDSLADIYRRQHLLLERGMVVWASLVQANNALFAEGPHDMPALLAYSLERHFEARPQALQRIALELFAYKGKEAPAQLQHIVQCLTSEQQRPQDLALPDLLTRRRVMLSSFLAIRKHMPADVMHGAWFPVLTHPDTLCLMIAPRQFWPQELVTAWSSGAMV